jgi:hypothetical protein
LTIAISDEMATKETRMAVSGPDMGEARSLRLHLNPNWEEVKEVSDLPTYMRKGRTNNNALQVSFLTTTSDVHPEFNPEKFIVGWVEYIGGEVVEVWSSESSFGKMASATFCARNFAYCQAWFSTDGTDIIQATFICDGRPGADELAEVSEMVRSTNLGEVAPSKKRG